RSATAATAPPAAPTGEGGPPAPPPNLTSNRRLQQTQAQVDEVVDIMRVNVDKVLERDQKLSELDDRADALQAGASQFETSAAKLKRKYWWKNLKMMIILGVICAIILIIIIGEWEVSPCKFWVLKVINLDFTVRQKAYIAAMAVLIDLEPKTLMFSLHFAWFWAISVKIFGNKKAGRSLLFR
uniref:Vesicle associated membrane protein 2 n=1 Tax=Equus asinus asinus TaxID=83772 RepID=A0A8C4PT22_EQUAS